MLTNDHSPRMLLRSMVDFVFPVPFPLVLIVSCVISEVKFLRNAVSARGSPQGRMFTENLHSYCFSDLDISNFNKQLKQFISRGRAYASRL